MRSSSREHMLRKGPGPAGSLQYSPPPMEYPRNSYPDPSPPSSFPPPPPAYIRNGELAFFQAPTHRTQLGRARLRKPKDRRSVLGLSSGGGGGSNGDWREGDQGGHGGSAAAAPGRGRAPAPRRPLRRAVAVRVSLPSPSLCYYSMGVGS